MKIIMTLQFQRPRTAIMNFSHLPAGKLCVIQSVPRVISFSFQFESSCGNKDNLLLTAGMKLFLFESFNSIK